MLPLVCFIPLSRASSRCWRTNFRPLVLWRQRAGTVDHLNRSGNPCCGQGNRFMTFNERAAGGFGLHIDSAKCNKPDELADFYDLRDCWYDRRHRPWKHACKIFIHWSRFQALFWLEKGPGCFMYCLMYWHIQYTILCLLKTWLTGYPPFPSCEQTTHIPEGLSGYVSWLLTVIHGHIK